MPHRFLAFEVVQLFSQVSVVIYIFIIGPKDLLILFIKDLVLASKNN